MLTELERGRLRRGFWQVEPATEVTVEYAGHAYRRRANEFGIWGFVHAADSERPDDLPRVKAIRAASQ